MTRLLSRLRPSERRAERRNGNGISHVRVVGPGASRRASRAGYVVTSAEAAPCTCPEFCERDHENE